jgi:capsular polysaccharide biosynthesis protein
MSVLPLNDGRNAVDGGLPVQGDVTKASSEETLAALTEQGAWEFGRQLAADPLVTQPESDANEAVINALYRCQSIMVRWGIQVDVVRTRRGCAVVRVSSHSNESYLIAHSAFEAIPANLGLGSGIVVEAAHNDDQSAGRLCTLLWTFPLSDPDPETDVVVAEGASLPSFSALDPGDATATEVAALKNGSNGFSVPNLSAPPFRETLAAQAAVDLPRIGADAVPIQAPATERPGAPSFEPPPPPPPPPRPTSISDHPQPLGWERGAGSSESDVPILQPPNSFVSTGPKLSLQQTALPAHGYPVADTAPTPKLPQVHKTRRPAWLWRRAWVLVVAVLAGMLGAQFVALGHASTYTARATLLVQSGAGASGPGAANDAAALAITYAAFIPTDGATIKAAARDLNLPQSQVSANITMSAESGTSVIVLDYAAPTAAEAIKGADAVARVVARSPAGSGIPSRSISVVREPVTASPTSSLRRYALPIGGIFGLAVGLIIVMAMERSDPHLDEANVVSEVFDCPSNALPTEIGLPELARAIALAADASNHLTVLPMERSDQASATSLVLGLRQVWPSDMAMPSITASSEFEAAAMSLSQGTGPTVVVLQPGASKRKASTVAERLRLIKRDPVWAVVMGRIRSGSNAS